MSDSIGRSISKMFKNRTKNQRETLKFKAGDFAYCARIDGKYIPEVIQLKITGECEDGDGYEALNSYIPEDWENKSSEVHTCNMALFRSKREAKEHAKELVNNEIKSLKEQQSIISKHINYFMFWQKYPPTFVPFDESKVIQSPTEKG